MGKPHIETAVAALLLAACHGHGATREPLAIVLPPPTTAEQQAMVSGNTQKGAPLQAAIGRDVPPAEGDVPLARLSWVVRDGRREGAFTVRSPQARQLRIGLSLAGERCAADFRFGGADGPVGDPFTAARLRAATGIFWSPVLAGDIAHVTVGLPEAAEPSQCALRVVRVSHFY